MRPSRELRLAYVCALTSVIFISAANIKAQENPPANQQNPPAKQENPPGNQQNPPAKRQNRPAKQNRPANNKPTGNIAGTLAGSSAIATYLHMSLRPVFSAGEIPRLHFKSWSLFLVCNPTWLTTDASEELMSLQQKFQAFGRVIGEDNVAIWFLKSEPAYRYTSANLDVERSSRFCHAFGLKPSEGPYVLFSETYPSEPPEVTEKLPTNSAVLRLGNMKPAEIGDLLDKLADHISVDAPLPPPTDPPPSAPPTRPSRWVLLLSAVQKSIDSVGCAWTFKVDAGPVQADMQACEKKN